MSETERRDSEGRMIVPGEVHINPICKDEGG